MSPGRVFLFAGGGTGGHLYPGLAIWEQLAALDPHARAIFLCSDRAIDARILSAAGVDFIVNPAKPLALRPRGLLRFLNSWGRAVREARGVIRRARTGGPVEVVAMGGFVAAPVVQAARAERAPVTLVNLDAVPGKANRWIAGRAQSAYTMFHVEQTTFSRAWTVVPPIVRRGAVSDLTPQQARSAAGLDPERPTLMVTGGSQGAASINRFVMELVRSQAAVLSREGWQILHQTGWDDNAEVEHAYRDAGVRAVVTKFVGAMGTWWRAATLAVARAGAGNVAEAWANATPAVFLPYPYHRDQHQKANARRLVEAGGALVLEDRIEAEANLAAHGAAVSALLTSPAGIGAMRERLRGLGPADGAERVARGLLGI